MTDETPIPVPAKIVGHDGSIILAEYKCPFCGHPEEENSLDAEHPFTHVRQSCEGCGKAYVARVVLDPVISEDYDTTVAP